MDPKLIKSAMEAGTAGAQRDLEQVRALWND